MKVAIIGDFPENPNQIRGGVQAAFAYLVDELIHIPDLEVHIIKLSNPDQAGEFFDGQRGIYLHRIPVYPRFELLRRYSTYQARLNKVLENIRPELLHAQDASIHGYVALKSGLPTVITVHGVRREDGKHRLSAKRRLRNVIHSRMIERENLINTRYLIAISRYVVEYFSAQLDPDAKIYYIPNAISEKYFQLADGSSGKTILFAGAVILRKRVLDLLQAFSLVAKEIPSVQLRIAGDWDSEPEYVALVQELIKNSNLKDQIHLLGALPEQSILEEFANCDILVLPSVQETTPMVIAQAMAAGKPVISTPVGGIPEMIQGDSTGILVGIGEVDELADALIGLLKNPKKREEMGRAGRQFAEENYRASIVAKKTHHAYRNVAGTN
jgi:glycosyltransferase involved in cell wall biosynthesis